MIEIFWLIIVFVVAIGLIISDKRKKYRYQGLTKKKTNKRKKRINVNEERCRKIFEKIFRCKFKSCRPEWLQNPLTGKNLELDGFNENIRTSLGKGLAFEYDGEQHSKYVPYFHGNASSFVYQVKKDSWKDKMCRQRSILLIRIPHYIYPNDLENYVIKELSRKGFSFS